MNIGILTQPIIANYGCIIQNYALQTILKRNGYDVWTIDYYRFSWLDWLIKTVKVLVHKLLGHKVAFVSTPYTNHKIEQPFRSFINTYINLTEPKKKHIKYSILNKYDFDAIIVGSDQVWRPKYNKRLELMFLSFLKDKKLGRIAYAASFGTDKWEFTAKQTQICAKLAKKFNTISVREKSAISLCANYFNVHAEFVLDPTLLLQKKDYDELCKDIDRKSGFVFAYILDLSIDKEKYIKDFASKKGLPYTIIGSVNSISNKVRMEEWLSCFRDASFVITDSFHGTVFSIIYGRDFYVFTNQLRGNSRFKSLLSLFDLEDRIVDPSFVISTKIDWDKVNEKLSLERSRSIEWLMESLSSI